MSAPCPGHHLQVHQHAQALLRELVELDTAACIQSLLSVEDLDCPPPSNDLYHRIRTADSALTRYLIEHRDLLGTLPDWASSYDLIDRPAEAGYDFSPFDSTSPADLTERSPLAMARDRNSNFSGANFDTGSSPLPAHDHEANPRR
ncbi:hypothetical protein [Nocardia sp. alder85J]|uniref:hypothetical protein n=1 Tax=Nocardia sp. alder85J TaxID=2862949 RepID=UPI001CD422F8|nr:hypothetical protein [Nocardia sp. alder85J]MCX4094487.1 hypothetical protein [Nocardia sp. alder85J]